MGPFLVHAAQTANRKSILTVAGVEILSFQASYIARIILLCLWAALVVYEMTPICPHCNSQLTDTQFFATLPKREKDVLRLFGEGLGISAVGRQLGISPKTIDTYRARILRKLGLQTTQQLQEFGYQFKAPVRHNVELWYTPKCAVEEV